MQLQFRDFEESDNYLCTNEWIKHTSFSIKISDFRMNEQKT